MNSKDFVLWFGGFVDAVDGIPTQAQWDIIKNKRDTVGEPITFPPGPITKDKIWPNITPWENPFKVTCATPESGVILTSTSGSNGTYNIPGGMITNTNTSWTNLPNGANICYTSGSK
jgi:hypothetical protein